MLVPYKSFPDVIKHIPHGQNFSSTHFFDGFDGILARSKQQIPDAQPHSSVQLSPTLGSAVGQQNLPPPIALPTQSSPASQQFANGSGQLTPLPRRGTGQQEPLTQSPPDKQPHASEHVSPSPGSVSGQQVPLTQFVVSPSQPHASEHVSPIPGSVSGQPQPFCLSTHRPSLQHFSVPFTSQHVS